jgi:GNAT superfamily N-acetyltransferase
VSVRKCQAAKTYSVEIEGNETPECLANSLAVQENHTAGLTIRPASIEDAPLILSFIKELAHYEKLSHEVTATEEDLKKTLFGEHPYAEVVISYLGDEPVGYGLFFHNYSTFHGRQGMYLEDIYVRPEARGLGVGKSLLRHLAQIAVQRGCARMEWSVLDWNQPAIEFYRSIGAKPMDEWTVYRLTGEALTAFSRR